MRKASLLALLTLLPAIASAGPQESASAAGWAEFVQFTLTPGATAAPKFVPAPPKPLPKPAPGPARRLDATLADAIRKRLLERGYESKINGKTVRCVARPKLPGQEGRSLLACLEVEEVSVAGPNRTLRLRYELGNLRLEVRDWRRKKDDLYALEEMVFVLDKDDALERALKGSREVREKDADGSSLLSEADASNPAVLEAFQKAAASAAQLRSETYL